MILDCTDSLGQKDLAKFGSSLADGCELTLSKNGVEICKAAKEQASTLLQKDSPEDSDVFELSCGDDKLVFNGYNYKWWSKNSSRAEKFESSLLSKKAPKKEEAPASLQQVMSVAVALVIDNQLSAIHWFEGPKADAVKFINDDMIDKYVNNPGAKIAVNLVFDKDEFEKVYEKGPDGMYVMPDESREAYRSNLELWYTISELEEIGAITTK